MTTLLNTFVTTQKRVVQMIREDIFFFLKVIKTALFPTEQSYAESFYAASKLVSSELCNSFVVASIPDSGMVGGCGRIITNNDLNSDAR
ncbi:MAG: hypothetical protein OXC68_13680 [Aestuariivita sp.]|nr:hypothetical protein [Aestuariivita sp.]